MLRSFGEIHHNNINICNISHFKQIVEKLLNRVNKPRTCVNAYEINEAVETQQVLQKWTKFD